MTVGNSHPAFQAMTIDLLEAVLAKADRPDEFPGFAAQQFLELTGAHTAILVQCRHAFGEKGHRIAAVAPLRRAHLADDPAVMQLVQVAHDAQGIQIWQPADTAPHGPPLASLEAGRSLAVPLNVGRLRVGVLLLLDLPELGRIRHVIEVLETVAKVIALAFRNALLFERQQARLSEQRSALDERTRQLEALFAARNVGLVVTDPEGNYRLVNDAFCAMTGYERSDLVGRNFTTISVPQDLERQMRFKRQADNGTLDAYQMEKRYRRKNGSRFWANLSATHIRNARGQVETMVGVIVDISERKLMEDQLAQASKLEAIGQLAGGVAHDFNNILTAINGYADLALDLVPRDEPLTGILNEIRNAGQRAAKLTRGLLGFGRKQIRETKVMDPGRQIRQMADMLTRLIGEDIELTLDLAEGLPPLMADPTQISQIVINLVVNAADAARSAHPDGRRRVRIASKRALVSAARALKLFHGYPGNFWVLSVEDNGAGIDKSIKEKIFDPFFTTKAKGKGTGMGLATVFGIIEQNKGFVTMDNLSGGGAIFRVFWPFHRGVKSDPVPINAASPDQSPKACPKGQVLVVEDDPMIRHLAVTALKRAGLDVHAAANGEAALEAVEAGLVPDVLFSDVVMPGIDGLRLAAMVRNTCPDVGVLIASGYARRQVTQNGGIDPAYRFIDKPYSLSDLRRVITEMLRDDSEPPTPNAFRAR